MRLSTPQYVVMRGLATNPESRIICHRGQLGTAELLGERIQFRTMRSLVKFDLIRIEDTRTNNRIFDFYEPTRKGVALTLESVKRGQR